MFTSHIENLVGRASQKLASLRIRWLLDSNGKEQLYKARIRSSLEGSCLARGEANITSLNIDGIQVRAMKIIGQEPKLATEPRWPSIQERRSWFDDDVLQPSPTCPAHANNKSTKKTSCTPREKSGTSSRRTGGTSLLHGMLSATVFPQILLTMESIHS